MKYFLKMPVIFLLLANSKVSALTAFSFRDTISDLSLLKTKAVYNAPNGKTYRVSFEADEQNSGPNTNISRGIARRTASRTTNTNCSSTNRFDGSYRKAAKTSIASHNAAGTNLRKLITRLLALDNESITVSSTSPRIEIEDSVVTLISVYLYAIAREADEDYHIIIGTSKNPLTAKFFNIECTGLPATSNPAYNKLKAVREKVVALLGNTERCSEGYVKFNDHPRVKIIGSLFYDKEHESNIPGPAGNKPATAWELHPITEFKML